MPETSHVDELDMIEELRLRRWARENYVEPGLRSDSWHPVVVDEMCSRDRERMEVATSRRVPEPHKTARPSFTGSMSA